MHIKRHLPEWVFVCQRRAGCPLIPVTPVVTLIRGREVYFTVRLLPWWSLDSESGGNSEHPAKWFFLFLLVNINWWASQRESIFLTANPENAAVTLSLMLSEKMSQKGFTHAVHPNRWPFPYILREVEKSIHILFNSKLGKLARWPWLLGADLAKWTQWKRWKM